MAEKRNCGLFLSTLNYIIIVLCSQLAQCNAAKLNEPKILLPYYSTSPSSYQIEIHDANGCFKWTSSRPEVVSIKLNQDVTCSHSVTVTAVYRQPDRVTTFLLAENEETGEVLRCDVIVDSISVISIETTTRELYLEDSPEKFQMSARDSEGNTFSTLEATPFEWRLVSDSESDEVALVTADDILRIIAFADSSYDTPAHIEEMELQGLRGDTILVEGIRTGAANVAVRLQDPAYRAVAGDSVRLIVIANVMLSPLDAYILLFTALRYRAYVIKQNVRHEISLPSTQYQLEVKDTGICSLNSTYSEVYGESLGSTQVVLRDKNMPAKLLEAIHQPTASVHVVLPGFIAFTIQPGENWVLEAGRVYQITVNVLDKQKRRIHLSESVRLTTKFIEVYFDVLESSINGSHHVVRAKVAGHTDITSALTSVIKKDGSEYEISPAIEGTQQLDIFDPISITPPLLAFPWIANYEVFYSGQFAAGGGSGDYVWYLADSSIAELGPRSGTVVQVSTKNTVGVSDVTASDTKNTAHAATGKVYVVPPEGMVFNAHQVEVEVGSDLLLPLAIFGSFNSERIIFTDCRQLPLAVTPQTDVFAYVEGSVDTPLPEGSCTVIRLQAKRAGHTVITATYSADGIDLKASITIAAFDPLLAVDPEVSSVLALGSSRILTFTGGPQPWVLDPSEYFEIGAVSDGSVVKVNKVKGSSVIHRLSASCSDLGEQEVSLTVGNQPTKTNGYPATRSASIRVLCKEPAGVQLTPQVPQPINLPPCPVSLDSDSVIPAHNYRQLHINVLVTDDQGRVFDNISSLNFEWSVSDSSLGTLASADSVLNSGSTKDVTKTNVAWYQRLSPKEVSGTLIIFLTLNWKLKKQVTLELVPDASLSPSEVMVFNHPQSSATLDVKGGSGFFIQRHDPENLATVKFSEESRQVVVNPIVDGNLRVEVLDLCLAADTPADSIIQMAGAHSIQLTVRDKVQQGSTLTAVVKVLDHRGDPLPAEYFQLMKLEPSLDEKSQHLIRIQEVGNEERTSALFIVKGVELGTASLKFVAQAQRGANITSNVQNIQVFPPLRLEPRNVTILVGAALGVLAVGGPQPQSSIEYSLYDTDGRVATISGSGLIEARAIGSVKVVAQAVGVEESSGNRIVYSEDTGEVHVVKLMGVRLYTPLSMLQTDTKMPVYAMGLSEHQTPFSFANIFPPLSFHWSTSNGEVASLQSVYHASDIELPVESRFSQQLLAKREGHVTVSLEVSVQQSIGKSSLQQIDGNVVVKDEQHIQVFNSLELLSPSTCAGQVLITPNTEARLVTNRDSAAASMSYDVRGSTNLLKVKQNGDIVSGGQAGSVFVLVTAVERFGTNQTLLLLVKIKPVSYIMLNCETVFKTDRPLDFVPAGSVLKYRVSSHDEVGQKFDFTNSQLRFRPNRFDLLQVTAGSENTTVIVHAPKVSPYSWGGTALKVWEANQPRVADYININVQQGIVTESAYVVGDVISLKSSFLTTAGEEGSWSTPDTGKLVVEKDTGNALAINSGTVTVNYNIGYQLISTQLQIQPLTHLHLDTRHINSLSLSKQRFNIPVQINNADKSGAAGIHRPNAAYPFTCHLLAEFTGSNSHLPDVSSFFTAEPSHDQRTGSYSCTLLAQSINPQLKFLLSAVEGNVLVSVISLDTKVSSLQSAITFLPPVDVRTKELYFTAAEPQSYLEVSATATTISEVDVKIEGRLSSMLHHSSANRYGDVYRIPFRLSTYNPESIEDTIVITDRLSEETYEIKVHILASNGTAASQRSRIGHLLWDNTDLLIFVLACLIVTIICLLIGSYSVLGSKKPPSPASDSRIFQNASPISSIGYSPSSGDYGSSPWQRQRNSGGKAALWSSGYEPQEASHADVTQFRKSPSKLMSPSF